MLWKSVFLFFLFCIQGPIFSLVTEEEAARRIQDHLVLKDAFSAVKEAKEYLKEFPESKKIHFAYLRALCEKGEEIEAFDELKRISLLCKEEEKDRFLFEMMAWGVLNKGETSSLMMIRLYSLLGAAFTQDARAIPILLQEMRSSNALLRSLAVKISASYGDAPLQDELAQLLKKEKVWYVRLEVIQAIGHLRITRLRNDLKEIIAHPKTLAEEKVAAIVSLVSMYDTVDVQELNALIHSDRAGLRELACEIVAHLELKDSVVEILPLLQDSSPHVRVAALNALGLLKIEKCNGAPLITYFKKNLNDPSPEVSITAGWLAMILGYPEGEFTLKKWMEQEIPEWKRVASAALSVTGNKGTSLAIEQIKKQNDSFVKANLALGLIGQRKEIELSAKTLFTILFNSGQELWMWDDQYNPLFRSLSPSRVKHIDQIPRYPHVVDQHVKLDLLSVLSIVRYPKALDVVKEFLKNQSWGITGSAASTLLEEGDEESLNLVRQLLDDPDDKIRIQAALILAQVGSDASAVKTLQEAYPSVEREMKIYILEALGHIGEPSSIPFLLEILQEPFQVLRVVAASALIQCLYH